MLTLDSSQKVATPGVPLEEPGRVLLVDDEHANRDLLQRRLERHGYVVLSVEGGEEALRQAAHARFDVVLLDVMMPGISGLETLRRLRQMYSPQELPVVMATARDLSEDVVEALSLGANDYVTKPIDFSVALARVKAQVQAGRAARRLRVSEERYALAAACDNGGLWDWNPQTDAFFANARCLEIAGLTAPTTWQRWLTCIHEADRPAVMQALEAHLSGRGLHWEREFRMVPPDGPSRWVVCRGLVQRDDSGHPCRFAGSLVDVTQIRTSSALTGLPNRVRFLDVVDAALASRARHPEHAFAVGFVLLNRWELTQDTRGAAAADALVQVAARRLTSEIRDNDRVAHLGANEFALLLDGVRSEADALTVAARVLAGCSEPVELGGQAALLGARIGIALADDSYVDGEELLRDAGIAAAQASSAVVDECRVFGRAMRDALLTRAETELGLTQAIERQELVLHYQPIVDLRTGQVEGLEALVRWRHPSRGLLHPSAFLAVAEETGLIVSLGRWCLREACRAAVEWRRLGGALADVAVSVNVSPIQFHHTDLVADVREALETAGLPASALKIEVTETAVMRNTEAARATLSALEGLGVRLALDDFGVGHSTLGYLSDFAFHTLKIDRSFVSRMQETRDDREIVRAVVDLARRLGVGVTAEGIETAGQLSDLQALDCATGQGYLLARPMALADVSAFVRAARGKSWA